MKLPIFIVLTTLWACCSLESPNSQTSVWNAIPKSSSSEGPKSPTSLWDLAVTKSHHSKKSEKPKFPGNFLPVAPHKVHDALASPIKSPILDSYQNTPHITVSQNLQKLPSLHFLVKIQFLV